MSNKITWKYKDGFRCYWEITAKKEEYTLFDDEWEIKIFREGNIVYHNDLRYEKGVNIPVEEILQEYLKSIANVAMGFSKYSKGEVE